MKKESNGKQLLKSQENMKTIICDIDGTLLFHYGTQKMQLTKEPKIIQGTLEKLHEWDKKGYNIILTTGRKESLRKITEEQLKSCGIFYDKLIMGIGGGVRVVINDLKQDAAFETALAINLVRNKGIKDVEV